MHHQNPHEPSPLPSSSTIKVALFEASFRAWGGFGRYGVEAPAIGNPLASILASPLSTGTKALFVVPFAASHRVKKPREETPVIQNPHESLEPP